MENAKVIKALRNCAKAVTYCNECPYDGKEWAVGCEEELMLAAADALEADEQRIAELMPKEGEWEHMPNSYVCVCTACSKYWIPDGDEYDYHYCPNCGARMKGIQK